MRSHVGARRRGWTKRKVESSISTRWNDLAPTSERSQMRLAMTQRFSSPGLTRRFVAKPFPERNQPRQIGALLPVDNIVGER